METTKIKCPHCGEEIEVDVDLSVRTGQVVPTPPSDESEQPSDGKLSFQELIDKFNGILADTDHQPMIPGMDIFDHLTWVYGFADGEWYSNEHDFFTPANYPDVCDFYGDDDSTLDTAYNAMQSWLFAMYLARICPTWGEYTNTQTKLYKLAYEIGGGKEFPLFGGQTFKANPYIARIIAGKLFAYTAGNEVDETRWDRWREELGGQMIPASCWDELGYEYTELRDENGWRIGFHTDKIGWTVNTSLFLPSAPAPRVPDTIVNEQPYPWQEGQTETQFNQITGNYLMDELAYDYVVNNYNMMAQTPLAVTFFVLVVLVVTHAVVTCSGTASHATETVLHHLLAHLLTHFVTTILAVYDDITHNFVLSLSLMDYGVLGAIFCTSAYMSDSPLYTCFARIVFFGQHLYHGSVFHSVPSHIQILVIHLHKLVIVPFDVIF